MKKITKNLLLVEDNAIIAFDQKIQLERHGYSVDHIINGEKAVDFIKTTKKNIDLILMDIDLGKGIDGTQAAKEILELKEIPVVFLSSHTEPEIVEKTESITSYGYVVKNSGITVLDASIKMAFKLFNAHNDILKHKSYLEIANDSLTRLEQAIETTQDIVFITNRDEIITYINPQFTKVYGYSKEETIGKMNPKILNEKSITNKENDEFWKSLANKKHLDTQFNNKTKNGKLITVETTIDPIFNKDGNIKEFIQIQRDITKHIQAENEISISNKYLDFINKISNEQANTTNITDLINLIIEQLKKISNSVFVSFSEYDKTDKLLKNMKISAAKPILDRIFKIAGKKILSTEIPVNEEYYKNIISKRINILPGLATNTGGAVDSKVSMLIEKSLGIDKIFGLAYIIDDQLYGTSLITLKKKQQEPNLEVLESFINISSISLRRLQLEKQIRESEETFRGIYEQSTIGIYRTTPEGQILMANPVIVKMLGYTSFDEIKDWDLNGTNFEPKYDRIDFIDQIENNGNIKGIETEWTKRDGTKLYVRESAIAIRDKNGNIMYYQGVIEDISEKNKIEQESKNYLDAINSMDLGLFIVNEDYSVRYMNDTMIKWFGDQTNLTCYKSVAGLTAPCPYCQLKEVIGSGKNIIYTPTTDDGRTFNIHGSLLHNSDGTFSKLEIIQDITELTSAHKHVETLLTEKEIILKEVHHRIKNNMMTIMGLLTFQEQSLTNEKVIEAFENTRNRVQSMMILYDKLYRSNNYQTIRIKEYFETILEEIIESFSYKDNVKLEFNIEDIQMEPGLVFNLGIIVNELITNSMKYALDESRDIFISVSVLLVKELITFTIKDSGKGFPDTGIINKSGGFGLELVKILSEQISADISFSNDNGAKVILKIDQTPGNEQ